jgi:hypothetical protein
MEEQKDERLWRTAKKRAGFKQNLISYFLVNAILWGIWWFTTGRHSDRIGVPWPVWVMLGWGIGLIFNYVKAYRADDETMAEKEYEKLKREKEGL